MWIFTRHGFFSVTAGHSGMLQIRARNEEHLHNLKKMFPELEKKNILTGVATDYLHRLIVTKEEWKHISAVLSQEVAGYGNFKNECAAQVSKKKLDGKYVSLLHDIWGKHFSYQVSLNRKFPFRDEAAEFAWSDEDTKDVLLSEQEQENPYEDYREEDDRMGLFEGLEPYDLPTLAKEDETKEFLSKNLIVPEGQTVTGRTIINPTVQDIPLKNKRSKRITPTWINRHGNK